MASAMRNSVGGIAKRISTASRQGNARTGYGQSVLSQCAGMGLACAIMTEASPASERCDRLTQAERECLQGILDRKTAKEMGRDLQISHHAVEKRLKRARQKLGVQSSLAAARLYAEHCGTTAYGAADLPENGGIAQNETAAPNRRNNSRRIALMITTIAGLAVAGFAMQQAAPVPDASRLEVSTSAVLATDQEVNAFSTFDRDDNGYVNRSEFLAAGDGQNTVVREIVVKRGTDGDREVQMPVDAADTSDVRNRVFDAIDRDDDDRISQAEFDTVKIQTERRKSVFLPGATKAE